MRGNAPEGACRVLTGANNEDGKNPPYIQERKGERIEGRRERTKPFWYALLVSGRRSPGKGEGQTNKRGSEWKSRTGGLF